MRPDAVRSAIAPADRVSDVIARDESLVEVFIRHAPQFERLRNRTIRGVMARLVTVEQAARMGGVRADLLLRDLNIALNVASPDEGNVAAASSAKPPLEDAASLAPLVHPAGREVVMVDVRDDLRSGREPFSRIIAAVGALGTDEVLLLRAIFEPVPLFTLLAKRGLAHESRREGPDDWSVWFWRPDDTEAPVAELPVAVELPDDDAVDESTVWLDVRGLQPPEPLMRTLASLETLPDGHRLVQVNVRVPQLLLPMLAERGYACEVDESRADRVLVTIWRPVRA